MQIIWDLLRKVESEPEKYIGNPSLENLFFFLSGIICYHLVDGLGVKTLPGFREYLCTKYEDPGLDFDYMHIIRMNSENEEDAFYRFYKLAKEYIKIKDSNYIPFKSIDYEEMGNGQDLERIWIILNQTYEKWNMFLGKKTLKGLENFLNGAKCYCEKKENKTIVILPGFDEYVKIKFKDKRETSAFRVIEKNTTNASQAFELFYELMFDFVKKMGAKYEPIVLESGEKVNMVCDII